MQDTFVDAIILRINPIFLHCLSTPVKKILKKKIERQVDQQCKFTTSTLSNSTTVPAWVWSYKDWKGQIDDDIDF